MNVAQGQRSKQENPERLGKSSPRAQRGEICEAGGCPAGSRCQRDRLVALLLLLRPQPEKEPARPEMPRRSWETARSSRPSFGRKSRSRLGRAARLSFSSGSGQLAFLPRSPPLAAPESKGVSRPRSLPRAAACGTAPSLPSSGLPACLPLGLLPELPCLQLVVRFLGGDAGSRSSGRAGDSQGSRSVPIVLSQRAARLRGCRERVRRQTRAEVEVIPEE